MARFRQQMADHARGERLKALRTERRLNQEDAAHEIGVSTKTLRTWEKGGPIRWDNAKAAGAFYEVEPESLVSREEGGPDLMDALGTPKAATGGQAEELTDTVLAQMNEGFDRLFREIAELRQLLESDARRQRGSRS